jgi:hypothetical protein
MSAPPPRPLSQSQKTLTVLALAAAYSPYLHILHVSAPCMSVYDPGAQKAHTVCPRNTEKVPVAHDVQSVVRFVALNVPFGHCTHAVAPSSE